MYDMKQNKKIGILLEPMPAEAAIKFMGVFESMLSVPSKKETEELKWCALFGIQNLVFKNNNDITQAMLKKEFLTKLFDILKTQNYSLSLKQRCFRILGKKKTQY